jgi:hypothetical protein
MQRYPSLKKDQCRVITFGASAFDFQVMKDHIDPSSGLQFDKDKINIVYIGRGGHDMQFALEIIFGSFLKGLKEHADIFSRMHLWFIGTSYAPPGTGSPTVSPLAERYNISGHVTEITDRIPYFESLSLLKKADLLLVPGSTDTAYTASKIYPYILAERPLIAVFHEKSSVVDFLRTIKYGKMTAFDHTRNTPDKYIDECLSALVAVTGCTEVPQKVDPDLFEPYTARFKTGEQTAFFDSILNNFNR